MYLPDIRSLPYFVLAFESSALFSLIGCGFPSSCAGVFFCLCGAFEFHLILGIYFDLPQAFVHFCGHSLNLRSVCHGCLSGKLQNMGPVVLCWSAGPSLVWIGFWIDRGGQGRDKQRSNSESVCISECYSQRCG